MAKEKQLLIKQVSRLKKATAKARQKAKEIRDARDQKNILNQKLP